MATVLNYNGYTSLSNVRVTRYETEVEYAQDDRSKEVQHNTIQGTAVIAVTSPANFKAAIDEAKAKLTVPRADLTFSIDGTDVVSVIAPDMADGPKGEFSISEIAGRLAAMVTFKVEWWDIEVQSGSTLNQKGVLSHVWTQDFATDEVGLVTWTVSGVLRVRADADDTSQGERDTGNNPDAFRLTVTPPLPAGFRRESANYIVDESNTRLAYQIVMQEHARSLPFPARAGEGRFTWSSGLGEGESVLGVKTFECELEGTRQVGAGALVDAAVIISANRIKWTGEDRDIIRYFELSELDIFTKNRIRLVIRAQSVNPDLNPFVPDSTEPFGSDLLQESPLYQDITPYGSAIIRAAARQIFSPYDSSGGTTAVPQAGQESDLSDFYGDSPTASYQVPDTVFDDITSPILNDRGDQGFDLYPYQQVESVEKLRIVPHVITMKAQTLSGQDHIYQVEKPDVIIESSFTAKRLGLPPDDGMLRPPVGSITLAEQRSHDDTEEVDSGRIVYTSRHTRIVKLIDLSQAGWETIESLIQNGSDIVYYRAFNTPNGGLAQSFDPRDRSDIPASNDLLTPINLPYPVLPVRYDHNA